MRSMKKLIRGSLNIKALFRNQITSLFLKGVIFQGGVIWRSNFR